MPVIASVHLADVGARTGLRVLRKAPSPAAVDGLRHADVATAAPLRGSSSFPRPGLGRAALIAFWEDDAALDAFVADHPVADALAGGWHARLEPLRAFGDWPGLPADISRDRATEHTGPSVVLTLGRLRLTQAIRFLRTSGPAERRTQEAPGFVWGTAMARPPFVATCSLWESTRALSTYAYGRSEPAHSNAIAADAAKPFHKRSAFIRFRPYRMEGKLDGRNPLPEGALAGV